MAFKLFVRDFAAQTDVTDLENLFSEVGTVHSATLTERQMNGVTRPVAYIEMSSLQEMRDCIDRFHGTKFEGRILTVTEDKQHSPDPNFSYKRPVQVARAVPNKN